MTILTLKNILNFLPLLPLFLGVTVMATLEAAAFSIVSSCSSTPSKPPLCPKYSPSLRLHIPSYTSTLSLKFPLDPLPLLSINTTRKLSFQVCSAVKEVAVEEKPEQTQQPIQRRKLFVVNLPWSFTVVDIKNLFGECGTVSDVEIIKQKSGKSRGFAFVTMSSGEEALAVIDKFESHELLGRIIKIEFAKRFKKPSRPPPAGPPPESSPPGSPPPESSPPGSPPHGETRHKLFVSNLAWKVRSSHLRELFSANFNPVSARVVFDSPTGRSAGYGFVSFATKEEADSAISSLDGKELLGRPLRLKFSQKDTNESENEEDDTSKGQPEES